jgi:hypothetical protein
MITFTHAGAARINPAGNLPGPNGANVPYLQRKTPISVNLYSFCPGSVLQRLNDYC